MRGGWEGYRQAGAMRVDPWQFNSHPSDSQTGIADDSLGSRGYWVEAASPAIIDHTALPPVHLKGKRKGIPPETARYLPERIDTTTPLGLGAACPLRPHNVSGVAFTRPTRGVLEEGKAAVDADHKVEQATEGYWLQARCG